MIQEIPIRNAVFSLEDNVKSKEKRQQFKICKPISLSIFIFFFQQFFVFSLFWWLNNCFMLVLSPAYDHKWPLRPLVLKTDVTLVKTLRLISLDFCYQEFILQWSDMQKSDNKSLMWWILHTKTIAKFILHSIYNWLRYLLLNTNWLIDWSTDSRTLQSISAVIMVIYVMSDYNLVCINICIYESTHACHISRFRPEIIVFFFIALLALRLSRENFRPFFLTTFQNSPTKHPPTCTWVNGKERSAVVFI